MKGLLISFISILLFLVGCDNEEIKESSKKVVVPVKLGGAVTVGELPFGVRSAQSDPTYIIVRVNQGTEVYASGVYQQIPLLQLELDANKNYTVQIQAVRKGTGLGLGVNLNVPALYGGYQITNEMRYNSPQEVSPFRNDYFAVFTKRDSSDFAWQQFPELDIYFAELNVNTSTLVGDTIEANLLRFVYGVELDVKNLTQGEINMSLGQYSHSTTEINLPYPEQTAFQIIAPDYNYEGYSAFIPTKISHLVNNTEVVLYHDTLFYNRLHIKRFEITLGANGSPTNSGISIVEEPLIRGDTIVID